jgi:TatD DNase family protein
VTATAKEFAGIYRNKQYHQPDFHSTLSRALRVGVNKIMLTGMSLSDVPLNLEIAKAHPDQCSITIGVHPYHAIEMDEGEEQYLKRLAESIDGLLQQQPSLLTAFGELGLDYDRLQHAPKEAQIRTFKAQMELFVAKQYDLPLFLHCRAAFDDFVQIMEPYMPRLPRGALVHSFVGSRNQMLKLVELGFDVSVNAFSFSDNESLQMVAAIPLERLQIETDAPWGHLPDNMELVKRYCANAPSLHACKKRDKWDAACMVKERNESCAIERVAYIVAGLKGIPVDEVARSAWESSSRMFLTR